MVCRMTEDTKLEKAINDYRVLRKEVEGGATVALRDVRPGDPITYVARDGSMHYTGFSAPINGSFMPIPLPAIQIVRLYIGLNEFEVTWMPGRVEEQHPEALRMKTLRGLS